MSGQNDSNRFSPVLPVPVFPLPNFLLCPGVFHPFQIFEPRYLQMVDDLLDSRGELVVGTVLSENEHLLAGEPPLASVAGLGRLVEYQELDERHCVEGGERRYAILVHGLSRVRIREAESDRLYRRVHVEPLVDEFPDALAEEPLRERLTRVMDHCLGDEADDLKKLSLAQMADFLIVNLSSPLAVRYELFCRTPVHERVQALLAHLDD